MVDYAMEADGGARCVLAVRQMLREVVSPELMLNPAIDMLLALYVARGSVLPWQDVCLSTGTSEDTCRRWGLALAERQLVDIDEAGCRLSDEGSRIMATVNARVWQIAQSHLATGMSSPAPSDDRGGAVASSSQYQP